MASFGLTRIASHEAALNGTTLSCFESMRDRHQVLKPIPDTFPSGSKIKAIQEDGAEFELQFEDDSMATLQLAHPGVYQWQYVTRITESSTSVE